MISPDYRIRPKHRTAATGFGDGPVAFCSGGPGPDKSRCERFADGRTRDEALSGGIGADALRGERPEWHILGQTWRGGS